MRRLVSLMAAIGLLAFSGAAVVGQPAEPLPGCDYFTETEHNLCEPFLTYWDMNGGLPVFGYPQTEAADELSPDLQVDLLTQYFERERMESHPENAGTPYEVQLGRLGNEVLLEMGIDWFDFPQADPSDPHYYAETGHAIAPQFWEYWSSNGLDLGEEGVSFAESVALFGYPISEAEVETNASGDTVLTQWFERARFELHAGGVLLGLLGNELLDLRDGGEPPPPPVEGEVIADGLTFPRGLFVDGDGVVYAIDSGIPAEDCITAEPPEGGEPVEICYGYTSRVRAIEAGGITTVVAGLPEVNFGTEGGSIQDVVVAGDGAIYGTIGLGGDPASREPTYGEFGLDLGHLFMSDGAGGWETIVDVAAHEGLQNPDGGDPAQGGIDSNPYSLTMDGTGGWVVSDAGANALLRVDADGTVSTLAVFDARMVAPPGQPLVPMQAVPTGVVQGPDGAFYVGELTGFPFEPGAARVWRVTAEGEATVYAEGFTNVIDLAFDGAGNLFVLEMLAGSLLNADPQDPSTLASRLVMVAPNGAQTTVIESGLTFATGLAMDADGTLYVSNFGLMPGMGQVVAFADIGAPSGPPLTVIASGLNNPRGLSLDGDGNLYVAQAGDGGDVCIDAPSDDAIEICFGASGSVERLGEDGQFPAVSGMASLLDIRGDIIGVHDVALGADGLLYAVMGLGANPEERAEYPVQGGELGWLLSASVGASALLAADIAGYELANNPDGGALDSNPFSLVEDGAGGWVISDAGANALLHVDEDGVISTLAVFPSRGAQSVPTGVVQGPDGAFYVGELTGVPFMPGTARIWRVTSDGVTSVYADGFTNIVDVAFDASGNLYVLEMTRNGLLSGDLSSAVVRVMPDGSQQEVASTGLTFATGLAIGPDGTFYVSNFGVMPGMGQVVTFELD